MYLEREKNYWSCWSYKGVFLSTFYGSPYLVCMCCFIVNPLVDSWSFILLGPCTLIVCVPLLWWLLPYGFHWYTNLSSFYLLVGPFTLWLYYKIFKCLLYGFINKDLWTIYFILFIVRPLDLLRFYPLTIFVLFWTTLFYLFLKST